MRNTFHFSLECARECPVVIFDQQNLRTHIAVTAANCIRFQRSCIKQYCSSMAASAEMVNK